MTQVETDLQRLLQYFSEGRTERAVKSARSAIKRHPGQPLPHNILGVIASNRADHAAAVKHFRRALDLAPGYLDALNNLGASLHSLGKLDEAERCYRQVLARNGNDADVHFNLGNVLKSAARAEEAGACYQRATELDPGHLQAHIELAGVLLRARQLEEAAKHYRLALEIDPQSVDAHCGVGSVLEHRQRSHEAVRWYREALEIAPRSTTALLGVGTCLLNLQRPEEAIAPLEQRLALKPGDPTAIHLLAVARGERTDAAPKGYVKQLFDNYSRSFESHLVNDLDYRGPAVLADLLSKHDDPAQRYRSMLDLGCGSGLIGEVLRARCDSLTGMDLSDGMLKVAADKGIYDHLVAGDISADLASLEGSFDLIACADAMIYLGDLASLAAGMATRAAPGARVLLSSEANDDDTVSLRLSGRYAHSRDYVQRSFEAAGFALDAVERRPLRKEKGQWVEGDFFLFRLPPG